VLDGLLGPGGDLLGATLTRLRTFRRFLDGEPDADPTAHFEPDIWRLERKTRQDAVLVEWELASVLEQEGRRLPGRQMLRDLCSHSYRRGTSSGFDYAAAAAPSSAPPAGGELLAHGAYHSIPGMIPQAGPGVQGVMPALARASYTRHRNVTCSWAREAMAVMRAGWLASRFQALRRASRMASQASKTRLPSLFGCRTAQMFSTGFDSGC
jgi:hypothetical protein